MEEVRLRYCSRETFPLDQAANEKLGGMSLNYSGFLEDDYRRGS
jgi:hypothetical protein